MYRMVSPRSWRRCSPAAASPSPRWPPSSLRGRPQMARRCSISIARSSGSVVRSRLASALSSMDYDVDGIAGSAILVRAFRQLGFVVGAYIPNRYEEGYGLNSAALRQLAQDGAKVIVSVDCGITAVKEAALARELGVDLIVTDHHHPPAELPDAYALVNPRRPGDPSIDKELAGAGVALVLAKRLLGDLAFSLRQDELLQLCALATVADVVPLRGGNRVLTRLGLEALNRAPLVGVRALVERAGLKLGHVGAGEIGFVLGPRLNAAGRIDDAEDALRLLLTEDAEEAKKLAESLEQCNTERQELTRQ